MWPVCRRLLLVGLRCIFVEDLRRNILNLSQGSGGWNYVPLIIIEICYRCDKRLGLSLVVCKFHFVCLIHLHVTKLFFLRSQVCKSEEAGVDEFCVTHFLRKTFHSLSKMLGWVRGGESVEYEARQATIPEGYPSGWIRLSGKREMLVNFITFASVIGLSTGLLSLRLPPWN